MTARAQIRSLPRRTRTLLYRTATAAATAGDAGQATAEYGLVILAAGGIALGVIAWANGTNSFTGLFQSVIRKLTSSL
jgi:hypothetical protein